MSSWGLTDNVAIAGTVTTYTTNATLTGSSTEFATNVDVGDFLTINSVKYQVLDVVSNTVITLSDIPAANASSLVAYLQTGPKWVQNVFPTGNIYSASSIYGIDKEEAGVPENRNRNLKVPGWSNYSTYVDALGQTRHKGEVLVALSKNFNAAGAGDASDDAVAADFLLYFTTQPSNTSNGAGNAAVLVSVAASDPTGASLTYQWYESPNNIVFDALSDAGIYSGSTTNTLTLSNITTVDGYYYKVTVSGNGGADDNTSDVVTVTVV